MITHSTWRLIDTKIGSGYWNMAIDEALLNGFKEGDVPILRLYGWENAFSLGKFSTISECLDKKKIEQDKFPIVRRMSGGGVLVHGGDLSYTLILPRELLEDKGVKENYRYLCGFLIRLYERLGHSPRFAGDEKLNLRRSEICLAGNEAYDIVINKNKMGGNAQRYTRHVLFQHGTIPMRLDDSIFNVFFRGESGLESAASLERLGTPMKYEPLSLLAKEAFSETFHVALLPDTLTQAEEFCAQELLAHKYSQERWNLHGQPTSP